MQCSCNSWNAILFCSSKPVQKHFDLVWCCGTVRDKIFLPWIESLKDQGCRVLEGRKVTDFVVNEERGCISEVICEKESFKADALILAVGISTLQEIVQRSTMCKRRVSADYETEQHRFAHC